MILCIKLVQISFFSVFLNTIEQHWGLFDTGHIPCDLFKKVINTKITKIETKKTELRQTPHHGRQTTTTHLILRTGYYFNTPQNPFQKKKKTTTKKGQLIIKTIITFYKNT